MIAKIRNSDEILAKAWYKLILQVQVQKSGWAFNPFVLTREENHASHDQIMQGQ